MLIGACLAPAAMALEITQFSPQGEIAKITLQINRQNNLPSLITLTMRNRTVTTIRISRIRTNVNQNDAIFTFNPKNYPKAEVVDLR